MSNSAKFDFNEIVIIKGSEEEWGQLYGTEVAIEARGDNDAGLWLYGFTAEDGNYYDAMENELKATGRFVVPRENTKKNSIKVRVNSKGEGFLSGGEG